MPEHSNTLKKGKSKSLYSIIFALWIICEIVTLIIMGNLIYKAIMIEYKEIPCNPITRGSIISVNRLFVDILPITKSKELQNHNYNVSIKSFNPMIGKNGVYNYILNEDNMMMLDIANKFVENKWVNLFVECDDESFNYGDLSLHQTMIRDIRSENRLIIIITGIFTTAFILITLILLHLVTISFLSNE